MITVGGLVENLRSNNKAARISAIRSLVQIRTDARLAVPYLVTLLDDPDAEIASLSLRVLALLGLNASLKPEIVTRLYDPRPEMRRMAAFAIGSMGTAGRDLIPLLAPLLKDEDLGVQMYAFLAIGKLSADSERIEGLR